MISAYAAKFGLISLATNVSTEKIDGSNLETYGMTFARFSPQDSLRRVRFFEKTLLLAKTSIKVILGMFFLFFDNVDVKFAKTSKKLT